MTSTLSLKEQIDPNSKYLKALATTTVYTVKANTSVASNLTSTLFTSSTTSSTYTSGTLLRDMGKRITTINAANQQVAKYILVQPQSGVTSEGVPTNYATSSAYVQVWAAASAPVAITVGRV